jgi:hypothetical protein
MACRTSPPAGRASGRAAVASGGGWSSSLLVNWAVTSIAPAPLPRTELSYTFLSEQLDAGSVQSVTSTLETIQGAFTRPVDHPPKTPHAVPVGLFTTQRRRADRRRRQDVDGEGRHRRRHSPGGPSPGVAADPGRARPDPAVRRAAPVVPAPPQLLGRGRVRPVQLVPGGPL